MKVLIDLSILKNVHCGLGQVALNYGYFFRDQYLPQANETIYLLVPKAYIGAFSDKVQYIQARKIYRVFPWLIGIKFDVWHAIHQLSRHQPFARKYILTIHDFNFVYEKAGKKVEQYLRKVQQKVDRADQIVAISQFAREETQRYMNLHGKQVEVIYNGVEAIQTKVEEPQPLVQQPYLFSIGEIKEKKNFHVLLDMMAYLPAYQLYIAGNDHTDYAQHIRTLIQEKGLKNVHLLGIVGEAQKVWLYRHAQAFVFPSLFEGFGLPVIEAMLFKKPVICSKKTSLVEIGSHYTTFFKDNYPVQESADLITQTIATYQANANLAEQAYQYACGFNWGKHMQSYLMLYRSLAQGGKGKDSNRA